MLDRAASAAELGAAQDALGWGLALSDLRAPLAYSNEAVGRLQTDYQQIPGRDVSQNELATWQGRLASGDRTLALVHYDIAHSAEAQADIGALYQQVLGRAADAPGLQGDEEALSSGQTLAQIRASMAHSAEAVGDVSAAYQTALKQGANANAEAYWQTYLAQGGAFSDVGATVSTIAGAAPTGQASAMALGDLLNLAAGGPGTYDPAMDVQSGWAPAETTLTLVDPGGAVLAVNSARDLLAVLPVYVTQLSGQTPNLVLADGRTVAFDNAVELANYLDRTAQHTAAADPLLGGTDQAVLDWLNQVDQPALQAAEHYAALARYDAGTSPDRVPLDQIASGLALQVAAEAPSARHALTMQTMSNGHQTQITVDPNGTVTIHDIDPGILGLVESVATVVIDALAVAYPVLAPAVIATNAAQAGQAFASGNVLNGILDLAAASGITLSETAAIEAAAQNATTAANLITVAQVVETASMVTGGVYGAVQGAQSGNGLGVLAGLLQVAAGAAQGLGTMEATPGTPVAQTYTRVVQGLNAAEALTSFSDHVAHGDLIGGLVQSLGPWLANLAAQRIAADAAIPAPAFGTISSDVTPVSLPTGPVAFVGGFGDKTIGGDNLVYGAYQDYVTLHGIGTQKGDVNISPGSDRLYSYYTLLLVRQHALWTLPTNTFLRRHPHDICFLVDITNGVRRFPSNIVRIERRLIDAALLGANGPQPTLSDGLSRLNP